MERNRLYNRDHPHRESPESRKKSNRKYRISSYGLTQKLFDLLLEAQQNACGMCHGPFEEGQLIHVDHDHACCRGKNRSCGECVRGLLCHTCNVALGHIERRYAMARAYLNNPVTCLRPRSAEQHLSAKLLRLANWAGQVDVFTHHIKQGDLVALPLKA